jgi:NAD+--asparagine ADP-ribosyltransferase
MSGTIRSNYVDPTGHDSVSLMPSSTSLSVGQTVTLNASSSYPVASYRALYISSQPTPVKLEVEQVWENSKDVNGRVYDPNTDEELFWDKSKPRSGQWDMGHTPEAKYSDLHGKYTNGEIDYSTFMKEYRNPSNYRPESPSANRSYRYE